MNHTLERLASWMEQSLPEYLAGQRWFGDKGRTIARVRLRDAAAPHADVAAGALTLVEVEFGAGAGALYQVPVALEAGAGPAPEGLLARVQEGGEALALVDGIKSARFRRRLLGALAAPETWDGRQGRFAFQRLPVDAGAGLAGVAAAAASAAAAAEQSNSSAVYRDAEGRPRYMLKLFRRLHPGLNPELEITAALAAHTGFRAAPRTCAQASYADGGGEYTLAVLQEYVASEGTAWDWLVDGLRVALAAGAPQDAFAVPIALLARRTAELHRALASVPGPAFVPEPITAGDCAAWDAALAAQAQGAGEELLQAAPRLPPAPAATARTLAARLTAEAMPALPTLAGICRARVHGDFHLGQVLRTADDFCILDFEGEPARPIEERRRKHCVLKDVAGMLRSFQYAAITVGRHAPRLATAAGQWERAARARYLDAYRAAIAGARPALFPGDAAVAAALRCFELEKAVYELRYELHHRPDWLQVPMEGLLRLL